MIFKIKKQSPNVKIGSLKPGDLFRYSEDGVKLNLIVDANQHEEAGYAHSICLQEFKLYRLKDEYVVTKVEDSQVEVELQ